MNVKVIELTSPTEILVSAWQTSGKEDIPSIKDIEQRLPLFLKNRHSPLRSWIFRITVDNVPYYNVMHFVRHKIGVEWYVKSQRHDIDRHTMRQDYLISFTCVLNAEAILNISEKRLCNKAEENTQLIMKNIVKAIKELNTSCTTMLANACQPQCYYLKECPENIGGKKCNEL